MSSRPVPLSRPQPRSEAHPQGPTSVPAASEVGGLMWPANTWDTDAWGHLARVAFADAPDRLAHALGAADFARGIAQRGMQYHRLSDSDGRLLVAAAYVLHIGKASRLRVTGISAVDGMMFLAQRGHGRLARLVLHHGPGPDGIRAASLDPLLALYDTDPLHDLLMICDLAVTATGTPLHPLQHLEACLAAPPGDTCDDPEYAGLRFLRDQYADITAAIREVERWAGDLSPRSGAALS